MVKRSFFPHIALLAFIFVIYSNTFNVPWLYDDMDNIRDNPSLHIDNLMPETLWQTFFAMPDNSGRLYRPVACFTFALNWFVGQDHTIGYHMVNMGIHYMTAILLYLCILKLFCTPKLNGTRSGAEIYFIALLASVLWAVNPIQTQAVTYIVQRMASLAGMFYIFSIFSYVSGRLETSLRRYGWFSLCGLSFLLAMGTKENSVLLPFSLLLIEYVFFAEDRESTRFFLRFLTVLSMTVVVAGILYGCKNGLFLNFFKQTNASPFSPFERLLTEFRIVLYYLTLIFYPAPSRLSIEHDVVVSVSLISPWTTLVSVLGVVALIFFSLRFVRRFPLFTFAVLFYFVNHFVESTIIPLELIFEHRNYIPSFFLMLPVSSGLYALISDYSLKNKIIYFGLIILTSFIILFLGIGTYARNLAYASYETFWQDTIAKAPNNGRAWSALAISARLGSADDLKEALGLHYRALNAYHPKKILRPVTLMNMGALLHNYGLYDQAIEQYQKALAEKTVPREIYYHLATVYLQKGDFDKALKQIRTIIEMGEPALLKQDKREISAVRHLMGRCYDLQGRLFLLTGDPETALVSFRKRMGLLEEKTPAFYHIGLSLSQMGYYEQADWFLKKARLREKENILISFAILENSIRSGNMDEIQDSTWYLLSQFDLYVISDAMEKTYTQTGALPMDIELIRPEIQKMAGKIISGLNDINKTGSMEREQINAR